MYCRVLLFVCPACCSRTSSSALSGELGWTLSNRLLATVTCFEGCCIYLEALRALKYSSSATFAGLAVCGRCLGCAWCYW